MKLSLPGILIAERIRSEFVTQTSEDIEDGYNPNPDWFQKMMDENNGEFIEVEAKAPQFKNKEKISLPWDGDGYLCFVDGVAYIICIEFTGYSKITIPNGVDNSVDLYAAMETAMSALLVGYQFGVKEGRLEKIQEFQNFLKG